MSIAYPGTYILADTTCTGSILSSSNLLKPWKDGCITSFTLTQSAIDANRGNKGNDAIFGAVFNTTPGLSCGADDVKSRLTQYFPPNIVQSWSAMAIPFVMMGENGCGAVWKLEGWIPTLPAATPAADQVVPTSAAGLNGGSDGGSKPTATASGQKASTTASNAMHLPAISAVAVVTVAFMLLI
ncbi:hypothetical protein HDU98_007641 [Podochytrium sp. JEL0797]|nr:hypothetical protein HDU98_007641 [Podochytrium sp. JEL0797]